MRCFASGAHPRCLHTPRQLRQPCSARAAAEAPAAPVYDKLSMWLIQEKGLPEQGIEMHELQDSATGAGACCRAVRDLKAREVRPSFDVLSLRLIRDRLRPSTKQGSPAGRPSQFRS